MIRSMGKWVASGVVLAWLVAQSVAPAAAQESVCARVKIEIKQELTLERQAFDAELRIANSLPSTPLTHVEVQVKVTDENGVPVAVTTDPNDLDAKFYIRQSRTENIDNVSGTGEVPASATSVVNWLLIPAPGSAGDTSLGKRYLVGATLSYRFGSETQVMELNPDAITVKPMPSLTLDYFLTRDVIADDPFTTAIEAPEPYTLGVRVKNSGLAAANQLKIDSAQPRIVDNQQGLPVNFVITGSYVQDVPATNSLLIDFGDIPGNSSKMGRWVMESNLAGKFVEFSASFTHSDELGGALTSLLQATNAHLLVRDVRVDLPGRDLVRDFLAVEGAGQYKLYESSGVDSEVTDRSAEAVLSATSTGYQLALPATQGFFYVRKPDPHQGQMALDAVMRADAKQMAAENVWLSKTKNADTQQWDYWFNMFDANSPGGYQMAFKPLDQVPAPPVLQFIPDRVVKETEQVSFLVEASSPMGRAVALSAGPLPSGASFQDQHDGTAVFDWTPEVGQAGTYAISYLASDGTLSSSRSAKIRVESKTAPTVPAIPQILAPLPGAEIASQRPAFKVLTGEDSNDPTQSVAFELYADRGLTQLLAQASVARNPTSGLPTQWPLAEDLDDNTRYHWRARAIGSGSVNSEWVGGDFFVNLFNNPPGSFNLSSPQPGGTVASFTPLLSVTNAVDVDGDVVSYGFEVYSDSALTVVHEQVDGLVAGEDGFTQWVVTIPLADQATYYWRAIATDEHGARTITPVRSFQVMSGYQAPEAPGIASPAIGARVGTAGQAVLQVHNSAAPVGSVVSYVFEVDAVNTFNSSAKQISAAVPAGSNGLTAWTATGLVENTHYYWRVRAAVDQGTSEWTQGHFTLDAQNDAPSVPSLANPGDGAWVTNAYPTFSVNPSTDPEDDAISYAFEVYSDVALSSRVASGTSATRFWQSSSALSNGTSYYWRARAQDERGAASAWSGVATFTVNTEGSVAPSIAVTSPSALVDASARQVTIAWTGTSPNGVPHIALYYDQTGAGFAGTRIVEGLTQEAGTQSGRYVWNMSSLPAGAYHVYGVIYDDKGSSQAYAPGTLVIPADPRLGQLRVDQIGGPRLTEGNKTAFLKVTLSRAPTHEVKVSLASSDASEAAVSPQELVFTPGGGLSLGASLVALQDKIADGDQPVEITVGHAQSEDPQFMGAPGGILHAVIVDNGVHTATDDLSVNGYELTSKTYSDATRKWTYRYRVVMSNRGPKVSTVLAKVIAAPGFKLISYNLRFGAIGRDESVLSDEEIVMNADTDIGDQSPELTWELKAF